LKRGLSLKKSKKDQLSEIGHLGGARGEKKKRCLPEEQETVSSGAVTKILALRQEKKPVETRKKKNMHMMKTARGQEKS